MLVNPSDFFLRSEMHVIKRHGLCHQRVTRELKHVSF